MIYKCPDCGIYWYVLSEYGGGIKWKTLCELLITDPKQTIARVCPKHLKIESAEVKA